MLVAQGLIALALYGARWFYCRQQAERYQDKFLFWCQTAAIYQGKSLEEIEDLADWYGARSRLPWEEEPGKRPLWNTLLSNIIEVQSGRTTVGGLLTSVNRALRQSGDTRVIVFCTPRREVEDLALDVQQITGPAREVIEKNLALLGLALKVTNHRVEVVEIE